MFERVLDDSLSLQLLSPWHAGELFELTDRNREYLKKWLPWLDNNTEPKHSEHFIRTSLEGYARKEQMVCAIFRDRVLVGLISFFSLNWSTRVGQIGYWLSEDATGRGIMTRCVRELERFGFEKLGLQKIEIRAAVGNEKSAAIPQRLGYTLEGTLRTAEDLYGHIVDHQVYGISAAEFTSRESTR